MESKTNEVEEVAITCRKCGAQGMKKIDEEVMETLRLSPEEEPFSTKKYTYQCNQCGATIHMTI